MATQYEAVLRLRFGDPGGVTVARVTTALDRALPDGAFLVREEDDGVRVELQLQADDTSLAGRNAVDTVERALREAGLEPTGTTVEDVKASS